MTKNVEELLPFYANGTLNEQETRQAEAALKKNPSLKKELAYLRELREALRSVPHENSPGEHGLKRLQKAIKAENAEHPAIATARNKIAKEQNLFWPVIAVAACFLLLLQTVYIAAPRPSPSEELTAAGGSHSALAGKTVLNVTFVPDAREENIRRLLLSLEAQIVEGPSALGLYKVAVPKKAENILEKLRAHKNLIETADYETALPLHQQKSP